MKIPNDCWHRPLLIPDGNKYKINTDCALGDLERISSWLHANYRECFNYIDKKIARKDIGVKV